MNDVVLTVQQIQDMKFALGYKSNKVVKNKFVPMRNLYTSTEPVDSWEELVSKELAEKASGGNIINYSVSVNGEIVLGKILDIKIN